MKLKILAIGMMLVMISCTISASALISENSVLNLNKELEIIRPTPNLKIKGHSDGYTLFAPEYSKKTYLINNNKKIVHTWKSDYRQALGHYLLENGNLLRTCSPGYNADWMVGGYGGRVEMFDWGGNLIWEFEYLNETHCLHNDIEPLPNGNILMLAWERKTTDEAIVAGCNPDIIPTGGFRIDQIIEVEPTYPSGGNIVWEWHVWDHLIQDYDSTKENYGVVADHPELFDINFRGLKRFFETIGTDFLHINAVDYNEEFDQVLVTVRNINEIWIIDHNTTVEEAAGHIGGNRRKGGDLLYRWGNPQVYDAGDTNDQKLFAHHDARWIEIGCPGGGHITIFNNGVGRPGLDYSSVEEIVPPVDQNGNYYLVPGSAYGPEDAVWTYKSKHPIIVFSPYLSGAQRLPNGNTFICFGSRGIFLEVTSEKETVWRYFNLRPIPIIGINQVFKTQYYLPDYPGLQNLN